MRDRFTLHDAARVLELPLATVQRLARRGALPVLRFTSKRAFVLADDLSAFIAKSYTAGPAAA